MSNTRGAIVWLPFVMGVVFASFVGIVLYDIKFIAAYGMRPFAIIVAISTFVGTFLGFSMQRMYEDFDN